MSLEAGEARLVEGRAAGVVRSQGPPTHLVDGAGTMRVSSGQNAMHAPGRAKTLAIKQTIHDVPPQYLCSQHAARSGGHGQGSAWRAETRRHGPRYAPSGATGRARRYSLLGVLLLLHDHCRCSDHRGGGDHHLCICERADTPVDDGAHGRSRVWVST